MSILAESLDKHRAQVIADTRRGLLEATNAHSRGSAAQLAAHSEELFDALAARLRVHDEPRLPTLIAALGRRLPQPLVIAALVRLAMHTRTLLLRDSPSRRVAAVASAAIDRALAETIAGLDALAAPSRGASPLERPPPVSAAALGAKREPTLVRNIRETLSAMAGDDMTASVVAIGVRPAVRARGATMVRTKQRVHDIASAVIARSGFAPLRAGAALLGAYVPARVDEADAHEALALALELARLPELTGCGIGVARGRLCANDKDPGEVFGEALLQATALAARAESGHVLCGEPIWNITRETFLLRAVAPGPTAYALNPEQPAWSERWEQAALLAEPTLAGRDDLVTTLAALLCGNDRSAPRLLGLRGRSGMGRTSVLRAALARAAVPAARTLTGATHPLAPLPYWPLITMLRQALELEQDEVRPQAVATAVLRLAEEPLASPHVTRSLGILQALLAPQDDDRLHADAEGSTSAQEIAAAIHAVITSVAARSSVSLVLVVNDAHRLDAPSAQAIARLLARDDATAPRLTVVLCYRQTFRAPAALNRVVLRELSIGRLDAESIHNVAASMLDQEDLPEGLATLLAARAEGSPLAANCLVRFLVETGAVQHRRGAWMAALDLAAAEIPRRLPELVRRRIEQLPAPLLALLKAAATLADPITWPALELIAVSQGVSHDDLRRDVGLLVELGFLRHAEGEPLHFCHAMLREVAYRIQTPEERRLAHRLAANALGERYPGAKRQLAAVLFAHFAGAGETTLARAAAVYSVSHTLALHDERGAAALITAGLAFCEGDEQEARVARFELLLARERIEDAHSARQAQRTTLRELAALAELLTDRSRQGTALHRAARLNLICGHIGEARELADRAVELLRPVDALGLSNALRTLALVHWHDRDVARARAALDEALAIYTRLGHARGMGFVLHSLGMFALDSGALPQARRYLGLALEKKRGAGDGAGEAAVLDALGQTAACAGDLELAQQSFTHAIDSREAAGDVEAAAHSRLNLAQAVLANDAPRAELLTRTALAALRGSRRGAALVEGRLLLARCLLAERRRDAAWRCATRAAAQAETLTARLLSVRVQTTLAEIDLAYRGAERATRAAATAGQAALGAAKAGAARWQIEALSLRALALARLHERSASDVAEQALRLLAAKKPSGIDAAVIEARCRLVIHGDLSSASPKGR